MNKQPHQITVQIIQMERGRINRVLIRRTNEDPERGSDVPDPEHDHKKAAGA